MISLKRSVSELEVLDSRQKASVGCFRGAIEAAAEHAVEIDAETTRRHRRELEDLARGISVRSDAHQLRAAGTAFRGALQEFAGHASRYVRALQEKVSATGRALADMAETIRRNQAGDRRLHLGLGQLHSIAQDPEIIRLCPEISAAVANVEESIEEMRRQNQAIVTRLQSEVVSLRTALESAEEAARRDPVTGVLNRGQMHELIRQALGRQAGFSLLLVWVSSYQYIRRRYGGICADSVLAGFCQRLRAALGEEVALGRWGEDRFAALIPRPRTEAVWMADRIESQAPGPFVFHERGLVREIALQFKLGVIDAPAGTAEDRLLASADKLLAGLESLAAPV